MNSFQKRLALVAIVGLVVVIGFSLKSVITSHKPDVAINVAPDTATLTADGSTQLEDGDNYLSPGKHSIKASLNGFTEADQQVTVSANSVTKVTLLLNPNSQTGYDYLTDNPSEELEREKLGGQQLTTQAQTTQQQNPIIADLPYTDQFYRIDYGKSVAHPDDPNAIAIYITYYSAQGQQQALQWLQFKGFDPSKLEILYTNETPGGD